MRGQRVLAVEVELAAEADDGDDAALLARFRRAIAAAARPRALGQGGAEALAVVLARLAALAVRGRAGLVLAALDVVGERLMAAVGQDDLWRQLGAAHLDACRELRRDGAQLASALFTRGIERGWPCFADACERYAALLGRRGLAEYRRLAELAWYALPALRPDRRLPDDDPGLRRRLARLLEDFAQADGDLDARIAIRAKSLDSIAAYRGIAELCAAHGRTADALHWAQEGLWQFDGQRADPVLRRLVATMREQMDRSSRRENARTPSAGARDRR
jgi:hypothetical protein